MSQSDVEQMIEERSEYPRVTRAAVEAKIRSVNYARFGSMTICVIEAANGYRALGQSASADPRNFDPEIGRSLAYNKALNELWALEGYLLCEKLYQGRLAEQLNKSTNG